MAMKHVGILVVAAVVASSALADLTYPVDPAEWEGRRANYSLATGEITKRNADWPTLDGSRPEGLDPDIVFLLQTQGPDVGDYDSRLYSRQCTEIVDLPGNELRTECALVKRPTEEQELAAENEAADRLYQHYDHNDILLRLLIQVGLNAYRLNSQDLPPKWQTFNDGNLSYIQQKILPIWERRQALKAEIDAGLEPDMDANWPVPGVLPE
jgi:hypothetical protein